MKLIIKFPNGDIVEICGYENSHQRLMDILDEDHTVILECEIIKHKPVKSAGTPEFLIAVLEAQMESNTTRDCKHLPFGEMVKRSYAVSN